MAKSLMKQLEKRRWKEQAIGEADNLALRRWEAFARKHDIIQFYTWHTHPKLKWGKKKIREIYLAMIYNQIQMIEEYRSGASDDDTHYLVMEQRLKADGIDVDELLREADQIRMPERKYEERQKEIERLKNEQ